MTKLLAIAITILALGSTAAHASDTSIAPEALHLIETSDALAVCHNTDGTWYLMPLTQGCLSPLGTNQRWDHYRSRLSGNTIIVKGKCIQGEDSAAHLKLIAYDDGGGRVVYGCYKRGY